MLCLRVLVPWLAVDAALWAKHENFGLLHLLRVPTWLAIPLALLALDLMIYGQHRLMHKIRWLWRMHRLHHSDLALDVTSAVRSHPSELFFSMGLKIATVLLLGALPVAVLAFVIVLNDLAMFTHANLALPVSFDRVLRRLLVTPDMHRIHHSIIRVEQDSNFGFNLSCWGRLFGSYRDRPKQPQATLTLGLEQFREAPAQRFDQLLVQPFRRE